MITATDDARPVPTPAERMPANDAGLFALVEELRSREQIRDELLDRLSAAEGDQFDAAARRACDAARAIYQRIADIKPTTAAGVFRQLEVTARGWVCPAAVPLALAALREIARRPAPFKVGKLPPVPPRPADQVSPA